MVFLLFTSSVCLAVVTASAALGAEFGGGSVLDDACDQDLQFMQIRAVREQRGVKAAKDEVPPDMFDQQAVGVEDANSQSQGLQYSSHEHWPNWPQSGQYPQDIPWNYKVDTKVKILLWTDWGFITDESLSNLPNCEFSGLGKVEYDMGVIADPDYDTSDFDVVIFHMPNLAYDFPKHYVLPTYKPKGQIWVAACGEPFNRPEMDIDCRLVNDTKTMERFDAISSFSLASDFPAIQDPLLESTMRMEIPDFMGPELATMVFSDCKSSTRNAWSQAVVDAFKARGQEHSLLSYGHCMNNAKELECHNPDHHYDKWINRCSARPFKIVPENSQESWYVTEKVWDALAEGTIPVYWGPPEVKLWVPEGSILFADDFESVDALVDRMMHFTAEDFAAARAWKTKPTREWTGWHKAWRLSHFTLVPRLCEAAAKQKLNGGKLLTPDKE